MKSHILQATPSTVHWGYFDAAIKPVLKIDSGDTITVDTVAGNPSDYEHGGIQPSQIPQTLREIWHQVEKGEGPHIITGPIEIVGSEPGDLLEVHIENIQMSVPFGYNMNRYGRGLLPEDFPYEATRIIRMNLQNMTSEILPGVVVPLKPFFGTLGVAPLPILGRVSSSPPGVYGGNIDNKELVSGSIICLPVQIRGANFSVGDGHAVQADGEINVTAIETCMKGTFQIFLVKNKRIRWPRAETKTHFITMGFHEDLDVAAKIAAREMIDFLGETMGISPENAYMLMSIAADLHVTQAVNCTKGIHVMLPKSIFSGSASKK